MAETPRSNGRAALKIAAIYALAGGLWILLSDKALELLIPDPFLIQKIQTIKGWVYVLITALLVYMLVRRHLYNLSRAQKRLERSRQDLQVTLRAAGMGYWAWNAGDGAMEYSPLAEQILASGTKELPSGPLGWRDQIHPDDHNRLFNAVTDHISGNSNVFRQECRIQGSADEWKWVMAVGRIIKRDDDGSPSRATGIVMDISEHKKNEQAIIRARLEAEHANRSKSDFLASMSHELRTPLNGVLAMLQLINQSQLDKENRGFLRTAYDSGQSLLRIINNLLSLTSAEAGKFRLHEEPVDLKQLLDTVAQTMQTQVPPQVTLSGNLDPGTPGAVMADAGKIEQICYNLVGNALKNTQAGSVELALHRLPHEKEGKRLYLLTVADTGCGISYSSLKRIFEPFVQVDTPGGSAKHGAGLGLGIVQRLAALIGGGVCLDTEEGGGTTVAVLLPLEETGMPESVQPQVERLSHLRVLVVDDDRINRMAVSRFLKKIGHEAMTAQDGSEALKTLREHEMDCVLMDIQMPGIDGIEATRRIRQSRSMKTPANVAIIAMTAHVLEEDRNQFEQADMDGFVPKPMQIDALADEIQRVMTSSKS